MGCGESRPWESQCAPAPVHTSRRSNAWHPHPRASQMVRQPLGPWDDFTRVPQAIVDEMSLCCFCFIRTHAAQFPPAVVRDAFVEQHYSPAPYECRECARTSLPVPPARKGDTPCCYCFVCKNQQFMEDVCGLSGGKSKVQPWRVMNDACEKRFLSLGNTTCQSCRKYMNCCMYCGISLANMPRQCTDGRRHWFSTGSRLPTTPCLRCGLLPDQTEKCAHGSPACREHCGQCPSAVLPVTEKFDPWANPGTRDLVAHMTRAFMARR